MTKACVLQRAHPTSVLVGAERMLLCDILLRGAEGLALIEQGSVEAPAVLG